MISSGTWHGSFPIDAWIVCCAEANRGNVNSDILQRPTQRQVRDRRFGRRMDLFSSVRLYPQSNDELFYQRLATIPQKSFQVGLDYPKFLIIDAVMSYINILITSVTLRQADTSSFRRPTFFPRQTMGP